MEVNKWRIKPVVVEAVHIKWDTRFDELINFIGNGDIRLTDEGDTLLNINTPKGQLDLRIDDYVVKDSDGNISVYSSEDFLAKHERHLVWDAII